MSDINDQLVLIVGESTTGKSMSLRNFATGSEEQQKRFLYLNCEAGKRLPFRNKFEALTVTDPYQVFEALEVFNTTDDYDYLAIDTLTFLMDMFESVYVINAANTMAAWGSYQQFFKTIMQEKVASANKPIFFFAHTKEELDESKGEMKSSVPVKGALKNNGIEAYFSTVVATKKVKIKELEKYSSGLLTITEEEKELGFKHVFQTRITKQTTGERIRSPMGLFTREQTYIDNDAEQLLRHLQEYYK